MKNGEKLLSAIGNIDEGLVSEALEAAPKKRGAVAVRWFAAAAAFAVVLLGGYFAVRYVGNTPEPVPPIGDLRRISFVSYDEYVAYLNTNDLNDTIVTYSKLKAIGDFKYFVVLSNALIDDYSQCYYTFNDHSGHDVSLYVTQIEGEYAPAPDTLNSGVIDLSDMRTAKNGASGTFTKDGVRYRYFSGELLSISWTDKGVEYKLTGSSLLSDYPLGAGTFVSGLLDANKAGGTVLQLMNEK